MDVRDNPAYQITWLVRRLFRALADRAERSLKNSGVTAADRAVMEFLYPDTELTVPEIAARYQVSRQHVQVTVNRLLAAKLLVTRSNPRHKRSPLVRLSDAGRSRFDAIRKQESEIIDRLFADIPIIDRESTLRTLRSLLKQLDHES